LLIVNRQIHLNRLHGSVLQLC